MRGFGLYFGGLLKSRSDKNESSIEDNEGYSRVCLLPFKTVLLSTTGSDFLISLTYITPIIFNWWILDISFAY